MHAGEDILAYFLLPFGLLVALVARAPFPPWLPRALAVIAVGLGSLFAVVGLIQAATHKLWFFSPSVEVGNAYSSFFRVTSLFRDPSLYGRHVVIGIVVLLVAVLYGKVNPFLATGLIGLMFAGLWFSYSQSSMAALFVVTLVLAALAIRWPVMVLLLFCLAQLRVSVPLAPAFGRSAHPPVSFGRAAVVGDGIVQTLAGELQWELHHRDHGERPRHRGARCWRCSRDSSAPRLPARIDRERDGSRAPGARREFIDAHFSRPFPLAELASVAGPPSVTFARAFKRRSTRLRRGSTSAAGRSSG